VAGETPLGYSPMTYVWMLLLALVPQLVGHSTYNWALRYMPAALVAVTTLGEPIGSTILAYFLLREAPTWIKLGGDDPGGDLYRLTGKVRPLTRGERGKEPPPTPRALFHARILASLQLDEKHCQSYTPNQ